MHAAAGDVAAFRRLYDKGIAHFDDGAPPGSRRCRGFAASAQKECGRQDQAGQETHGAILQVALGEDAERRAEKQALPASQAA
jgi:hypothetical protein